MKRILYFDCFAGISGDMTIAALIDLGLNRDEVIFEIKKLGLTGYEIEINSVNRFSISGTDVNVKLDGKVSACHSHEGGDESHSHKGVGKTHSHNDENRSLGDIIHIINSSSISPNAKNLAIDIFREIAKAEAVVHGRSLEEIHFHEVGAVDSIIDIVGSAICIDLLNINEIYCSKVHDGQGFVNCRHGRLPIPVPAVAQMMKNSGISIVTEEVEAELVTPTGFGILKTVKKSCGKMPDMEIKAVGYGFGKKETGNLNALRVFLGSVHDEKKYSENETEKDSVVIIETNIDDVTGEVLGYTLEKLIKQGALDAYLTPIQMKKNRPGIKLSVICKENQVKALAETIFLETGTLGIRICENQRMILPRDIRIINTKFGPIRAKVSTIDGKDHFKPEYEDCVKIAEKLNLPLRRVQEEIS